jgi:uncharacterized protein YkwD
VLWPGMEFMRSTQRSRILSAIAGAVVLVSAAFAVGRLAGLGGDGPVGLTSVAPDGVDDLALRDALGPGSGGGLSGAPALERDVADLAAAPGAPAAPGIVAAGAGAGAPDGAGPVVKLPMSSGEPGGVGSARTAPASLSTPEGGVTPAGTTDSSVTAATRPSSTAAPSMVAPTAKPANTAAPSTAAPSTKAATTASPSTRPATTAGSTAPAGGMSGVEQEIVRMTNELRTNPTGPLARVKGAPTVCTVATDTGGKPAAAPALLVDSGVSQQMSRSWSMAMDGADNMSHRPNDSQQSIYGSLGISPRAWGENVAWFQGYSDAEAARVFFEGWRESDGHYCNMMSPNFTKIGVGVHKGSAKVWATQNFYGIR